MNSSTEDIDVISPFLRKVSLGPFKTRQWWYTHSTNESAHMLTCIGHINRLSLYFLRFSWKHHVSRPLCVNYSASMPFLFLVLLLMLRKRRTIITQWKTGVVWSTVNIEHKRICLHLLSCKYSVEGSICNKMWQLQMQKRHMLSDTSLKLDSDVYTSLFFWSWN